MPPVFPYNCCIQVNKGLPLTNKTQAGRGRKTSGKAHGYAGGRTQGDWKKAQPCKGVDMSAVASGLHKRRGDLPTMLTRKHMHRANAALKAAQALREAVEGEEPEGDMAKNCDQLVRLAYMLSIHIAEGALNNESDLAAGNLSAEDLRD